jgi:hypothetical protein
MAGPVCRTLTGALETKRQRAPDRRTNTTHATGTAAKRVAGKHQEATVSRCFR